MTQPEILADQLAALEERVGSSAAMVAAFEGELARFQSTVALTGREVSVLSSGLSGGLRRAFDGVVFDGMKLSDALKGLGKTLADTLYSIAIRPITSAAGGALGQLVSGIMGSVMPFEKGGSFTQGRVMPFASGGIVSSPVMFPMRGGRGLMGEAGPEAIMPLTRGADGRLGVAAQGGGRPVNIVMNIATPDVQGFRRSETQIAAQVGRVLARGQRNR